MYSVKPSGNSTLYCNAGSTRLPLNVPELLWSTRSVWKSLDSSNIETFSLVLLPLPEKVIQSLVGHCDVPSNFALNSSTMSSIRIAPLSSREIYGLCRSKSDHGFFDTAKQSWRKSLRIDVYSFSCTDGNRNGRTMSQQALVAALPSQQVSL